MLKVEGSYIEFQGKAFLLRENYGNGILAGLGAILAGAFPLFS